MRAKDLQAHATAARTRNLEAVLGALQAGYGQPVEGVSVDPGDWEPWHGPLPERPPAGRSSRAERAHWELLAGLVGQPLYPTRVVVYRPPHVRPNRRVVRDQLMANTGKRWKVVVGRDFTLVEPLEFPAVAELPWFEHWTHPGQAPYGIGEDGQLMAWDMDLLPSALVGASTRFGKTTFARIIVLHCALSGVFEHIVIIDPKGTEYDDLADCPLVEVATAPDDLTNFAPMQTAIHGVRDTVAERRKEWNERIAEGEPAESIHADMMSRRVLLLVDELARVTVKEPGGQRAPQEVKDRNAERDLILSDIAITLAIGAQYGVHGVYMSQSPRADVLGPGNKQNAQARFYFGPGDSVELGIIFGDNLPPSPLAIRGEGVWRDAGLGAESFVEFKGFYLSRHQVRERLAHAGLLAAA